MADSGFDIKNIISQIKRVFQGLTTLQKSMVIAISVVLVMFLVGLSVWAGQERLSILISDLNPIDANAVVESLKQQGVRYELSSDQRTIYVPEKQVSHLKLKIAGENILTGDQFGFEKLDSPGLTTTDFTQKTNYRLSLEKKLAKHIVDGLPRLVKNAKVNITPQNDSIFISEKEDAKASVLLNLMSNRIPQEENIQSIMHYVAYSVEGLKPENVFVSDQLGRLLSKRDSQSKITDAQRKMQLEQEDAMVVKVKEQLEPAVGVGKVMVSATVELDFDKVQINEEKFDPQGQIERSMETEEERSTKRDERLGIPGTPTNVAPADAGAEGANIVESKDYRRTTTNFDNSVTRRAVEKSPGSVKRVSVSVLLDQKTTWERDSRGNPEQKSVEWTPEELEKFRNLVIGAAGIDNARGDIVTVDSLGFAPTTNPQEEAAARRQQLMDLAKILAPFAILLLAFIGWLVYKIVTREKVVPVEEPALISIEEIVGDEMVDTPPQKAKTLAELRAEIEQEISAETASQAPESQRREVIKQRISEVITTDPETAASLVRSWLVDDEA